MKIDEKKLRKAIFKLNEFEAKSLLFHTIQETLEKKFDENTFAFEYLNVESNQGR